MSEVSGSSGPSGRLRSSAALGLLLVPLPVNLAVTAVALARSVVVRPQRAVAARPRTVLISGGKMTKALQLARLFHRAGHRVVLVETARYRLTGHRFSRAVDAFHVVPDPGSPTYVDALLDVVRREQVDVYVPVCSPAASLHDAEARAALSPWCDVVHGDGETVRRLDDKYEFFAMARDLGLPVPDTHRITDPQQVVDFDFAAGERRGRTYILKSIAYDPVHRLDLTPLPRPTPAETAAFARSRPISETNPWILQELVVGDEYCTHGTVRGGALQVHACCRSSAFQVNYEMVDKPEIEAWVRRLVGALGVTGQVSIDFIETADGTPYAIECNPRTHSAITMFYDQPDLARAYLEDDVATMTPTSTSRPTYWTYHELWRMLRHPTTAPERMRVVARGKDAIFDWDDPLPSLLVPHLQVPSLLLGNLRRGQSWIKVDFNIGKLVQPAGD